MATIQEISQICGVSVSTVSKALNGYTDISEKTRELVFKTANELGYLQALNTKSLKMKKTYNIGVLFSTATELGLRNEYFIEILTAFKNKTAQYGYDLTFVEQRIGSRKMTFLEYSNYRKFDGILVLCEDFGNEEVLRLINSDFPVVTIDYAFMNSYSIISDNYNGMKQLVNYVIRQGHTQIGMIHGAASLVTKNRIDAFYDALKEKRIRVPDNYIIESSFKNIEQAQDAALKLLQLPSRPSCILAPDDYSSLGVINAIRLSGLKVIKDVSVAGYNGIASSSAIMGIKLTTVKQDTMYIGKEAADKLIQMIEKPNHRTMDTMFVKQTLMIGNSVRKII